MIDSFHSTAGLGKGIPLGNLTSQIFANIYMHELDAYMKHTLKARYYIRYADDGVITLEFGESDLPYQPLHTGIDIAGRLDDPVTPAMDGTVIYAGEIFWGFGKHIIIDNGNNIQTIYAHLDKIYVYPGEKVTTTDVIGGQGETGWATGVHLHFQVNIYGIPVNPRIFLGNGNPPN